MQLDLRSMIVISLHSPPIANSYCFQGKLIVPSFRTIGVVTCLGAMSVQNNRNTVKRAGIESRLMDEVPYILTSSHYSESGLAKTAIKVPSFCMQSNLLRKKCDT